MSANNRQVGGSHYHEMGIQPWEVFERTYEPQQFADYLAMTAVAYVLRAGTKGPASEDLAKAAHCLEKAVEVLGATDEPIHP